MDPDRRPPGPNGSRFIGNIEAYEQDRLGFLIACARDYGDIVAYDQTVFIINSADLVDRVLTRTNQEYAISQDLFRQELKDVRVATSLRVRRDMAATLRRSYVLRHSSVVAGAARALAAQWVSGREVSPQEDLERLTARSMAEYCFGADGAQIPYLTRSLLDALVPISTSPFVFPTWLPTPRTVRARPALSRLRGEINRIVARRLQRSEDEEDALAVLLRTAPTVDDAPIHARASLIPVLVASLRVPAAALCWALYLLARYPEYQDRVRCEAERELKTVKDSQVSTDGLNFTANVVHEALRLYPPAWLSDRRVIREDRLSGYAVKPGYRVVFSPYVIHRDPRYYKDAEAFRPERWSAEETVSLPRCAYLPFGAGPRSCIGSHFGMMEVVTVLAVLVRYLHIRLASGGQPRPDVRNTMVPAGLRIAVTSAV